MGKECVCVHLYDGAADVASGLRSHPAARDDTCDVIMSGNKWEKTAQDLIIYLI